MANYKHIDTSPRLLALDPLRQLLPGTFEHSLSHLLDHEIDLSAFDQHYRNDDAGAPAYPPRLLLKVVLFAYSKGIVGSRPIAAACVDHMTFVALSGFATPHFTTIADFISRLKDDIASVFSQVLMICDRRKLIGREMFAIDGVKLPSNASKRRSGTRAEFQSRLAKLEAAAQVMLERHREQDQLPVEASARAKEGEQLAKLQREASVLRDWLKKNPNDRPGTGGKPRKSNITDNDSAKMGTSKGVIQGYTGVATVDERHQIIVDAQAHGTGSEQELLLQVVDSVAPMLGTETLLTADAGYHSEANLKALAERKVNALIADGAMRKRDERFADQDRHRNQPDPLHDKSKPKTQRSGLFTTADFVHDQAAGTCLCPAGKSLALNSRCTVRSYPATKFRAHASDCRDCPLRAQCLRNPDGKRGRQVAFLDIAGANPHSAEMRARIDSPEGRARYSRRFATVEPVFGNLRGNKRLCRFTLRGKDKVDAQWKLFCLVHNIEKLANLGWHD